MRKRSRRVDQKGFTLLEVLVATAILGTAIAALLSLLSGALRNSERLQAPAQALLLGQSKMNELLGAGVAAEDGTLTAMPLDVKLQGRWDEPFRWEAVATRVRSSPERMPGETILVQVALNVFWKPGSGNQERKLSLETYQLRREPPMDSPGVASP